MGPTWGPPASCRSQVGPMLAPWTLLSGYVIHTLLTRLVYTVYFQSPQWNNNIIDLLWRHVSFYFMYFYIPFIYMLCLSGPVITRCNKTQHSIETTRVDRWTRKRHILWTKKDTTYLPRTVEPCIFFVFRKSTVLSRGCFVSCIPDMLVLGLNFPGVPPGGCSCDYYPSAISLSQVTATYLQIGHP